MSKVVLSWTSHILAGMLSVRCRSRGANIVFLKDTEVYVHSRSADVEDLNTLAGNKCYQLRRHSEHTPADGSHSWTNRREWSILLPNPCRNAQHAGQMLSEHHAVVGPSSTIYPTLRYDSLFFMLWIQIKGCNPTKCLCQFLQNEKW